MNPMRRLSTEEDGQDLVEYTLLCALMAVACMAAMRALGSHAFLPTTAQLLNGLTQ